MFEKKTKKTVRTKQTAKQFISITKCNIEKDLRTHYSVELPVQINVAIGPVCHPLPLGWRRGTGLWSLAWVCVEIWLVA